MYKPLLEAQLNVLKWINDDRPSRVYDDGYEHRVTARALERRGLVKVRGHGDSWTAEIADDGQYYPEHGRYVGAQQGATQPTTRQDWNGLWRQLQSERNERFNARLKVVDVRVMTYMSRKCWRSSK